MTPSPETSTKLSALASSTPNGKSSQQRPKFLLAVNGASDDQSSSEPNSPPEPSTKSSQCSSLSDGESTFECFGEMTSTHENNSSGTIVGETGVDLDLAPQIHSDIERNSIARHSWARTSLRGLRGSMKRPLPPTSSNALANHLYRSSSFNSSGRSSNCDTTEDMYSDVSLEDVQDLNHKLEMLQQQVTSLADNSENKHARAKTETAVLQAKYHMLEEQLRETELRYEERLVDEQKRHRELLTRVERDAELKMENAQIRIRTLETEQTSLRDEIQRTRSQSDKQLAEIRLSEEKLETARFNLSIAQENLSEARAHEKRYMMEKNQSDQMVIELHKEVERIRNETQAMMASAVKRSNFHNISASSLSLESNASSEPFKIDDMMNEIEELKLQNRQLQESNEELQAMLLNKNIEEGRNLLNGGTSTINLADELKEMGQTQDEALLNSLSQLQEAYQEKDEECRRLKRYIDTILLNIVENYPQLLEIKTVGRENERSTEC